MKHHAKASSAGSSTRQARGLGRDVRGAFVTRPASSDADGSGAPSARCARLALVLLSAALILLAIAPGAGASILTRARTASFGTDGTTATHFGNPGSLAVDQASHRLYVLDRVDFNQSSTSAVLDAFETPGLAPLGGAFPLTLTPPGLAGGGIAVDNTAGATAGHLFFVDNHAKRLYGYDEAGVPLGGTFPISLPGGGEYVTPAVDSVGNVYVADASTAAKNIRKYSPTGTLLGTISTATVGDPARIAFDSNDDLIFSTIPLGYANETERKAKMGVYRATASSGYNSASFTKLVATPTESAGGIAVDTGTHTLYEVQQNKADAYDATTGALLYEFATGIANAEYLGIAVDQATDTVYIADRGSNTTFNTPTTWVHAFGPAQSYADATATPTAATNITDTSAQLGATVADNNVLPTNWRLQISSDNGANWSTKASGQTASKSATVASTGLSIGTLTVKAGGGTLKLSFEGKTTSALAYNASAATVQAALQGLSTIGIGNVEVTEGPGSASGSTPYKITFTGALAGTNVGKVAANGFALIGAPEAVSATVTGLDPNTKYQFRVLTNKGSEAATEVASGPLSFTTVAPPPVVTDIGAIQVTDTSARLIGTIDPRNTETGYVFEYGTTPALGSSTAPLNIGGGTEPITVSQVVGGLQKDTTYYFRLAATNLAGTTASASKAFHTRLEAPDPAYPGSCPNEARRTEQGASLPDCRAWEMVSPNDKNQGGVGSLGGVDRIVAGFSRDGEGVGFCSASLFGEPAGQQGSFCAAYLSHRGPGGWSTTKVLPPFCPDDSESGEGGLPSVFFSPGNFERAAFSLPELRGCATSPLVAGAPLPSYNLYRADETTDPASYDLLSPEPGVEPTFELEPSEPHRVVGGSGDFSHVVYSTRSKQTSDSPPSGQERLYDWREEGMGGCAQAAGCLSPVAIEPGSGEPFAERAFVPDGPQSETYGPLADAIPFAISEDGRRIYFDVSPTSGPYPGSCLAKGCELYMREGDSTTLDVGQSECTLGEACGSSAWGKSLRWASPAGGVALFESCSRLTGVSAPAAGCTDSPSEPARIQQNLKLYRWDRSAQPGSRLTDLTVDGEPADGVQPEAVDVIGASSDENADPASNAAPGNTVYFVAGGQLVAGEPTGEGLKLYRWRWNEGAPSLDYLGRYRSVAEDGLEANQSSLNEYDPNSDRLHERVTADGRYLLIQTKLALDPAADRDEDADLYRWDEADGWICVSCQLPGTPSLGSVSTAYDHTPPAVSVLGGDLAGQVPEHTIADDGKRVFFTTPDALVPADVNGEDENGNPDCPYSEFTFGQANNSAYRCADLYEWHDGTISLLSSGTSTGPVVPIGATADGRDVFFTTRQHLLGWDTDTQVDVYDARAGGGFPEPPAQPAECEGAELCHGAGTSVPAAAGAGTAVFEGPGNPAPRHRKTPKHRKHKAHHKRHRAAKRNRRAGR